MFISLHFPYKQLLINNKKHNKTSRLPPKPRKVSNNTYLSYSLFAGQQINIARKMR